MAEFNDILKRVVAALEKNDLNYVIIGGMAAIFRGKARTTMDIDIFIEDDISKIFDFLESLKETNFDVSMKQAELGFSNDENVSVFDNESVLRLDLKIAKNADEIRVLNRSKIELIHGLQVQIATPEDILYGKILFLGDISDLNDAELLEFNDVLDFINVFEANNTINSELIKKWAKSNNLEPTYNRLMDIIKKKKNLKFQ
mgnify:FL=1